MQKTFQQDVINRKVIKNTGQLPMCLIENHHEGIVNREKYDAVQAEMARWNAAKSPSKRAASKCFLFMYFLQPHWVPAFAMWRAQTSIRETSLLSPACVVPM